MQRGQFSSRWAFILAASGSAVGLGNVWGFPTNAAEHGGGAFVLMYFVLAFFLAYPALMAELIIGRHTRSNMVDALQTISNPTAIKHVGALTGFVGIVTASLILCFYSVIAGWMVAHMIEPVTTMIGADGVSEWLVTFSDVRNVFFIAVFLLITAWVISSGVEDGIERWSRRLMPALFLLLLILIAYVLTQEGAIEGLQHYLVPDFSKISDPQLVLGALGQAFFSLSLGVGTMLIYGSYLRSDENLPVVGALVTLTDISVAFLAGLLIVPAMFVAQSLGVAVYTESGSLIAGPDLIFQVLPALFDGMGTFGNLVALAFFVLMSIAALTSSISMLEVPVAFTIERTSLSRPVATWSIGLLICVISSTVALNFDAVFGLVISLTTEMAQPLLGVMLCLYAGWAFSRDKKLAELKQGNPSAEQGVFWKIWPFYVKFLCPVLILLTFLQGVLN